MEYIQIYSYIFFIIIIYFFLNVLVIVFLTLISKSNALHFLGPSEQPEAYFNGSSYIRLETTISLKRYLSFSFRSCLGSVFFSCLNFE